MADVAITIGVIGAVIVFGIIAHLISLKTKIPSILTLLGLGIIIGPIVGFFDPSQFPDAVQAIVTFALILVLFQTGYQIKFSELKKELGSAFSLGILALVGTIAVTYLAGTFIFGFTTSEALLLGAILASTDLTIMAPILEGFRVKDEITQVLSLEATFNTVFAIIIATVLISFPTFTAETLFPVSQSFLYQIFVGVGLGVLFGYGLVGTLKLMKLEARPELLTIGLILLIYAVARGFGASGIFAVFAAAVILGNSEKLKTTKFVLDFGKSFALLTTIFVYVILGSLLKLDIILSAIVAGIVFAVLIALARLPATYANGLTWSDRNKFMSMIGPRGLTVATLALFYLKEFQNPDIILGIIFIVILISVVLAGSSYFVLRGSRKLRARAPRKKKK